MPYRNPNQAREYQREYRRIRRAGDESTTPCTTPMPIEFRLKQASDVLALIEEQIAQVRGDQESGKLEKARCIGYLAGIALKAIDAGNLAGRIEALETVLNKRQRRIA